MTRYFLIGTFLLNLMLTTCAGKEKKTECEVSGPAQEWVNGFCLILNETEDFDKALVKSCIARESLKITPKNDCQVSRDFKKELCEIHIRQQMIPAQKGKDCLANPEYDSLWRRAGPPVSP